MAANYHKYQCSLGHVTLILRPVLFKPEHFQCPACLDDVHSYYIEDILVKGLAQIAHGTYSSYNRGCRCDLCREACRLRSESRRKDKKYRDDVAKTYREKAHQELVDYMGQNSG